MGLTFYIITYVSGPKTVPCGIKKLLLSKSNNHTHLIVLPIVVC